VIAVGLVFIARALSGSLNLLARLQTTDRLVRVAQSVLAELELQAQQIPPLGLREGSCDASDGDCRWTLTVQPARLPPAQITDGAFRAITLTIVSASGHAATVRLHTLWPSAWVEP
jgi:hypothetical protein